MSHKKKKIRAKVPSVVWYMDYRFLLVSQTVNTVIQEMETLEVKLYQHGDERSLNK